jgi:hypothetical protein
MAVTAAPMVIEDVVQNPSTRSFFPLRVNVLISLIRGRFEGLVAILEFLVQGSPSDFKMLFFALSKRHFKPLIHLLNLARYNPYTERISNFIPVA